MARTLALAGIIGPIAFTSLVVLQGLLQPDYSHIQLPISALAAWPAGWLQVLNFYMCGLLIIAFAYALHLTMQHSDWIAGVSLLMGGGVGLIVAGTSSWERVDGVLTEPPLHVVGAILTFSATGFGFIALSRRMRADEQWRDLATYALVTGIIILLLFIAVGFFAIEVGTPLHAWAGLLQRILCVVWFTCMIVLARRARRAD